MCPHSRGSRTTSLCTEFGQWGPWPGLRLGQRHALYESAAAPRAHAPCRARGRPGQRCQAPALTVEIVEVMCPSAHDVPWPAALARWNLPSSVHPDSLASLNI